MTKKILFVSHDLSRSGAPNMLLQLIQWLRINTSYSIDLVGLNGGAFYNEFSMVCDNIFIVNNKALGFKDLLKKKVFKKIGINHLTKDLQLINVLERRNYELVYANSALSLPFASKLKQQAPSLKLLLHVHEMEIMIKRMVPYFSFHLLNVDRFIAASNPVKINLELTYQVSSKNIEVIYEFSDFKDVPSKKNKIDNSFIVGASGLSHWRKGNDLFLQVARIVKKKHPDANIQFVWVGNESTDKLIIDTDLKKLQLNETVSFIGETSSPMTYFNNFDIFLLTSREDPFPLVCIEVAKLGKPIICFKNASGTAEIIELGGGKVVPYLDVEAMAVEVINYYTDGELLERDSKKVQALFSNYNATNICPQILRVINNLNS